MARGRTAKSKSKSGKKSEKARQAQNRQNRSSSITGRRPTASRFRSCWKSASCPTPLIPVNISKGEQFKPDFLKISPNNRMPAIVDPAGPGGRPISIFESGAILQYLGRKTGKFYPREERARVEVEQWLFWQMGGIGPMAGQLHHFKNYAVETLTYAINRYTNEMNRLYGVMNMRLKDREFIAGKYSIADMAHRRLGQRLAAAWAGHQRVSALQALAGDDEGAPGGAARHGARPRAAPGHRHEGSESAGGAVRPARAGELSGRRCGDLARWLAAPKPARLAISHQNPEISICRGITGCFARAARRILRARSSSIHRII